MAACSTDLATARAALVTASGDTVNEPRMKQIKDLIQRLDAIVARVKGKGL